jgi:hypothetical protein
MTGAAAAGDSRRDWQQAMEDVVNAPSPDTAVPPASSDQAGGLAAGGVAAVPGTAGEPGAHRTPARIAKDIGLFFVAPYVTLAYLAMFPYLGMKLLAQVWRERKAAG